MLGHHNGVIICMWFNHPRNHGITATPVNSMCRTHAQMMYVLWRPDGNLWLNDKKSQNWNTGLTAWVINFHVRNLVKFRQSQNYLCNFVFFLIFVVKCWSRIVLSSPLFVLENSLFKTDSVHGEKSKHIFCTKGGHFQNISQEIISSKDLYLTRHHNKKHILSDISVHTLFPCQF